MGGPGSGRRKGSGGRKTIKSKIPSVKEYNRKVKLGLIKGEQKGGKEYARKVRIGVIK
jgi:hypothetical protein